MKVRRKLKIMVTVDGDDDFDLSRLVEKALRDHADHIAKSNEDGSGVELSAIGNHNVDGGKVEWWHKSEPVDA